MLQHFHLPSIGGACGSLTLCSVIPSGISGELIIKAIIAVFGAIPTIINLLQRKNKKREEEKQGS